MELDRTLCQLGSIPHLWIAGACFYCGTPHHNVARVEVTPDLIRLRINEESFLYNTEGVYQAYSHLATSMGWTCQRQGTTTELSVDNF